MAVCYDKHFEVKNRWQNQRIDKRYKNQSNGLNDNYYSNDSFKSFKISQFDLKDYDKSIKSNNIPIWNCSRCTYTNTKRKSQCSICNLSYKASKSYKSCNIKIKPQKHNGFNNIKPKTNHVTLADFCNNIMDELNESIPVWICNECTYCNIEQLPQCQICLNPYSHQIQQQQEEEEEYEYIYSAEQQFIMESVECMDYKKNEKNQQQQQQQEEEEKCINKNKKKYTIQYLKQFKNLKSYKSMPINIINPISDILAPGLGIKIIQKKNIYKLRENKANEKRIKFTMNELIKLKKLKQCESMPYNIINKIPDILSPGLGIKKRVKLNMNELMKFKDCKSYKSMPINIINPINEILAPGLGIKSKKKKIYKKRNKFNMDKLIKLRENKLYKSMPQNLINKIPDILSPGLGIKTISNSKRAKFTMNELKKLQKNKECKLMPINIINDIPEILAIGLGHKYENKLNESQFNVDRLIKLRDCKSFKSMPENIINEISDILSPELSIKTPEKRRKFSMDKLIELRIKKQYKSMPDNIINEIPEIGMKKLINLKMKKKQKKKKLVNIGFIGKQTLFNNKRNYYKWNKIQIYNKYTKSYSNYNRSIISSREPTANHHPYPLQMRLNADKDDNYNLYLNHLSDIN